MPFHNVAYFLIFKGENKNATHCPYVNVDKNTLTINLHVIYSWFQSKTRILHSGYFKSAVIIHNNSKPFYILKAAVYL